MKGLWLENQSLEFRTNLPEPAPRNGEALVRVRATGICGTDLQLLNGYYPFAGVAGHEFVGEVVAAPDQPDWVGQRVVGEINISCGTCNECHSCRPTHCINREVLGIRNRDGAFAEFLTLPLANLHRVPDNVSDQAAAFTEPLAAALEILEQIPIRPSDSVLVVGAGRLGQLVAQVLATTACVLKVVARYPKQRERLIQRNITVITEQALVAHMADIVVEATGSPAGLAAARKAVRPRGTIVLKSTYKGDVSVELSRFVVDELTVVGSRCGPFAPALKLLEEKKVDPTILIDSRYSIEQADQAFTAAAQKGALKVLIEFQT